MVAEKMKLQILRSISEDLANHVDKLFDDSIRRRKDSYDLEDVIEYFAKDNNNIRDHIKSKRLTSDVMSAKRDIAFTYYCLACPFFYDLGVDERLDRTIRSVLFNTLTIPEAKLSRYILSAKHYYRIYDDYKIIIDAAVSYIRK